MSRGKGLTRVRGSVISGFFRERELEKVMGKKTAQQRTAGKEDIWIQT